MRISAKFVKKPEEEDPHPQRLIASKVVKIVLDGPASDVRAAFERIEQGFRELGWKTR